MNQTPFPELRTERLLLRKLKPQDWEVISYLRSDAEINKYVDRPTAETKEEALQFIEKIDGAIASKSAYYWSIVLANTSEMAGTICLWNFSEDRKTAEVGYDLSSSFQGKGIMSEALQQIVGFGFTELKLDMLEAYTHKENLGSSKLLEKQGFQLNQDKKDNYCVDNVVYEIERG